MCAPAVGMLAGTSRCASGVGTLPAGAVPGRPAWRWGSRHHERRPVTGHSAGWRVAGFFASPALLSTGGRSVKEGIGIRSPFRLLLGVIQVRACGEPRAKFVLTESATVSERRGLRGRACRARAVNTGVCVHFAPFTGRTAVAGAKAASRGARTTEVGNKGSCPEGAGSVPRLPHDACFPFFCARSWAAEKHLVVG